MDNQPKISMLEAFLLTSYIALTDVVGLVLVLVGLDDFFIIDILTFPVTQFYFRIKGIKGNYDLIANLAEIIPYVGALPIRTVGVLLVIWIDRHPRGAIAQVTEKATQKIPVKGIKTPVGGLKKAA